MSRQTDPQAMVRAYGARIRQFMPVDRSVALSRRDLEPPRYRITRSSLWKDEINPWKEKDRLPLLEGGLLGELIYGDEPRIIDDLVVDPDDPAAEYLAGQRSLMAIPNYDRGVALNMTVLMRSEPGAFDREQLPEWVWMSNLFGRATHNLVLSEELKRAYALVERELKVVADIQRSLLPKVLPDDPDPRPGRPLPDVAVGRRRLLRLLPAPRRPVGHPDRRRQRPRHARGGDDGHHPQHRPRLSTAPSTRRGRCSTTSTSSWPPATPPTTRRSSPRSTASTTPSGAS